MAPLRKMSITDRVSYYVREHPIVSAVEISKGIKVNPATVSSIVNRLVKTKELHRKKNYKGTWVYWWL